MSDYIFTLNGGAVCWKNYKQHTVTDSVCEAEYNIASNVAKEMVWLQKFIIEPGVHLLLMVVSYCIVTAMVP